MFHVMIVDDEQMIINSLALGFDWRAHGYEIIATSTNSREALKLIEFIHPDVVFSDIKMPGLTGLALMEKVHATLPKTQFIFISGYSDFKYVKEALRLGAAGYCLKPLENEDIEEALTKVTNHLKERQLVIQSAFELFMQHASPESAEKFLEFLYAESEIPKEMTVLISLGDAASLLSGHVCYSSVQVTERCYLYFITANRQYLSTPLFKASLFAAVSQKEILSLSWQNTKEPASFLRQELPGLFDAVYSYFMNRPAVLDKYTPPQYLSSSSEEYLKTMIAHANKGRIKEVLNSLAGLADACPDLRPSDTVTIYNTCNTLISHTENKTWDTYVRYVYELASKYKDFHQMLEKLTHKLQQLAGSTNPETVSNDTFRKVLDYINHNFTCPLSFQEISEQYGLNPSYLSQLFKKELGVTFTDYLTNLRIQYAKELLETTSIRISEIPERIGYRYDYNLAKLFKKETGYSPREYREMKKKTLE